MIRKIRSKLRRVLPEQKGQALIPVLILLLLGSLSLPPLLSYMQTSLKSGRLYEKKTDELYAADSGIEDVLWWINNDSLESLLTEPAYSPYDFDTTWSYGLSEQINKKDTTVSIENIWIPKDVPALTKEEGETIIDSGKLVVTGNSPEVSTYQIQITFYPEAGEEDDLRIETIGIWLPLGFTYVPGSSSLEDDAFADYYSVPEVESHCGGQAIIWNFMSVPFTSFPGAGSVGSPKITEITLEYTAAEENTSPSAVSWTTTSGVSDVPLSWDAETKVFRVVSVAGGTEIEVYFVKYGLRKLGSALEGDYRAIGNSLMIDINGDSNGIRDLLLADSTTAVTDIPDDADVVAAYLYWSGWLDCDVGVIYQNSCSNFGDWDNPANDWGIRNWGGGGKSFVGHHISEAPDWHRYLALKDGVVDDLSSYEEGMVRIQWQQYEWGDLEDFDALLFQFSGDGGVTWGSMNTAFAGNIGSSPQVFSYIIPNDFLTDSFKMRFYLQGFGGGDEYCYIDNFSITFAEYAPDTSIVFEIDGNRVYFDGDGQPAQGTQALIAGGSQVLPNFDSDGDPNGFSYACFRDVTALVRTFSAKAPDPATNYPGNGSYTVGGVDGDTGNDWSYAGWSLLIVYSSVETEGHQLYLYDDFIYAHNASNIDFDGDGEAGGNITGFIVPEPIGGEEVDGNAAKMTIFVGEGDYVWWGDSLYFNGVPLSNGQNPWNNVWNSRSYGMSEDGVDIDTFEIKWSDGLLEPGDTSAQLELPTGVDSWNLVYIILSLRSETVTGGTTHYVIRSSS
ncbi:MAG TPA: hypothetical protein G4O18_08915 [Dehalococcoidia bacterium]|nr:hypothetical protein [Dehalococcoidia bacterium]